MVLLALLALQDIEPPLALPAQQDIMEQDQESTFSAQPALRLIRAV